MKKVDKERINNDKNPPENGQENAVLVDGSREKDDLISKTLISLFPTIIIAIGSFLLVFLLHYFGAFNMLELKLYDFRFKLRGPSSGIESNSALPQAEGFIDRTEPFLDKNNNGFWDGAETFTDSNNNGKFDPSETFEDTGNGIWDEGENYVDLDGNGQFDDWDEFEDEGNDYWDEAEPFTDINKNGIWDGKNKLFDAGIDTLNSDGVGCWLEESCINNRYDPDEEFTDIGNGIWDAAEPFEDINNDGNWNESEPFRDDNNNGSWDRNEPIMDINNNGYWDDSEVFSDLNGNSLWDTAEEYIDENENGLWDEGEELFDLGNGIWDEAEAFVDMDECEKTGQVCQNGECLDYKECHDINQNGKWDDGLDVVIVERDDESFRLIPDPLPYSRANVWARVVRNLTAAGAKVIVFDLIFDKPDHQTKNLESYRETNKLEFPLIDGDEAFIESIQLAESTGVTVVLASRIAHEASRIPPTYYLPPYEKLMNDERVKITTGLVNIPTDSDGFKRRYWAFGSVPGEPALYPTLAVQTVVEYLEISDVKPQFSINSAVYGPLADSSNLQLSFYGRKKEGFLINFIGPPSGASAPGKPPFDTFSRIPLSNVLDTEDYDLGEGVWDAEFGDLFYYEDQNWMDKYIDPVLAPLFESQGFLNPFKDKIVIIGSSLAEDHDFTLTPFSNYQGEEYQFPGVEYHANAIQHLLNGDFIQTPMGTLEFDRQFAGIHLLLVAVLVIITLVLISKAPPLWGFLIMAIEVLIWVSFSIGAFLTDYLWLLKLIAGQSINMPGIGESALIPVLFPISAIVLPFGINLTYKLITEGQDKKFLKNTFGTFVSPALIDQMYESKEIPSLGGTDVYNTCFFSDIASFSSFSEKMTAPELVILLNEYLEEMTNILLDNGGTLDKYIGDAIIAIFGSPIPLEDHEYRGVISICQMNEKLEELRQKWKSEGDKWPEVVHNMRHRIGLNTGQIVAGNMGSSVRMSYTMMGDAVNTTARLESGAKQYGIESQVGEKVYEVTKDKFFYRALDHVRVKGKIEPVKTFELICEKGKEPENYKELVPLWDKAVKLYTKQQWNDAIKIFNLCDKLEEKYIGRPTNPSLFFIKRCEEYKADPPGNDWDGIYTLKSK